MMYWNRLLAPVRKRESSMKKTKYDYRSPFKKDFDTICNSSVLRRLQDKAQVFPLEEEDYARTRLTHSIETLSIAESLGIGLKKEILKRKNVQFLSDSDSRTGYSVRSLVEDIPLILMGAALLHDMGNPPFGHLSEQAISHWFSENLKRIEYNVGRNQYEFIDNARNPLSIVLQGRLYEDLTHFDGNAQLLRLVTKLSLVVDENGMNLTYPVMASFIKYPCDSLNIDNQSLLKKKAGFFSSEAPVFYSIVNELGLSDGKKIYRHPLAFLVEAADDIAYLTADIEDAHHKGIITLEDIDLYLNTYGEDSELVQRIRKRMKEYKQLAINKNMPKQDDYAMHRLRILIKGEMINAIGDVFANHYEEIMNGKCINELLSLSTAKPLVAAIRALEKDKVYYCKGIRDSKIMAEVIIKKLLDVYVPCILNYQKDHDDGKDTENNLIYESFSANYKYICEKGNRGVDDKELIYNKLRLVVDQVSGMTDSRALSVYQILSAIQ